MTVNIHHPAVPTSRQRLDGEAASKLSAWYRFARKHDPKLGASYFFREPTRLPRYMRRALHGIRRYEPLLQGEAGRGVAGSLLHYWRLYRPFGHTIDDYYRYGLYRLPHALEAAAFLSERRSMVWQDIFYKMTGVDIREFLDKALFADRFRRLGLPAIPTVAKIEHGRVTWGPGGADGQLPSIDLITKPNEQKHGRDVRLWKWSDGVYLDASGERFTSERLLEHLCDDSRNRSTLIQPRIRNSEPLIHLAGGGLCTLRILTSRSRDGDPEIQSAVLKMPTGSNVADNFANHGIGAPVEIDSGEVGPAVSKSVQGMMLGESFSRHPDTNEPIAGLRLRDWRGARDVCIEAHRRSAAFHSVGWDIAMTNEGPVLIEGNQDWDTVVAQQPGLLPLGQTALIDHVLSFAEERS